MMNGGLLSTRQGVVYGCPGESIGTRVKYILTLIHLKTLFCIVRDIVIIAFKRTIRHVKSITPAENIRFHAGDVQLLLELYCDD